MAKSRCPAHIGIGIHCDEVCLLMMVIALIDKHLCMA